MLMKYWPAVLLTLGLSACAAPAWADDKGPAWITDYARARTAARAAGKPIFLVFRCER
jgi:hypothetical protein